MLNFSQETVVSLNEACSLLPRRRGGKRPHVATLHRWITRGCRGVRLETVQVGATRCTSVEALDRFFAKLTAAAIPVEVAASVNAVPKASSDLEAALDREGL